MSGSANPILTTSLRWGGLFAVGQRSGVRVILKKSSHLDHGAASRTTVNGTCLAASYRLRAWLARNST